jgi:hypothetical protein
MRNLYLTLVGGLLALPTLAQQPLAQRQLPITRRSADNSTVVTETRSVGAALDALLKEPAAKAYHADLQALKAALGGDAKTVRTKLKPVQDRLKTDRPRVQLGSFARGLDSLLSAQPAAVASRAPASTAEPTPTNGVKPIPDQPTDETEQASADTSALSAPVSSTVETTEKASDEGLNYWMLGAIVAALAALALGFLYAMAKREIERLRRKETFGSNEQLMGALRKQVASQHEEIKQLRDENDALRRASAPLSPVRSAPRPVPAPEPLAAVLAPEAEPQPQPEAEAELEPAPIPPIALAPEPPVAPAPQPRPSVTFFLSTPNRDGSFSDVRRGEFIPSQSFYQFRLTNPEGTEAEFVFADDPASVRQALSSPETYLQPACAYTDLRLDAQRIRTVHLGKARQTAPGERWEVVEKAEVAFG